MADGYETTADSRVPPTTTVWRSRSRTTRTAGKRCESCQSGGADFFRGLGTRYILVGPSRGSTPHFDSDAFAGRGARYKAAPYIPGPGPEYGFDVIHWTLASNTLADSPTDWESKNGCSRDHSSCYNATTRENWVKPYLNATSAPLDIFSGVLKCAVPRGTNPHESPCRSRPPYKSEMPRPTLGR